MGLLGWMLHPAMLALGGLAVAVPIIIHLLNKRRYKIVDWAAMDFLLEADKKNRRRVKLENFILLALRCLAMLLLGLLLARPFLPSAISNILGQKEQFERIVLIDDSLSQNVLNANLTSLDVAKKNLRDLLTSLAETENSDDWLTLFTTSNTEQPLLANEPVTKGTLPNLVDVIDRIQTTDGEADYRLSLDQVNRYLSGARDGISRVTYVYSDLRRKDWMPSANQVESGVPNKLLAEVGKKTSQGFLVDVAAAPDHNAAIVGLRSQDNLVANRVVRFEVDVANFSPRVLSNIRVKLQIDEQPPISEVLATIAPGATETLTFRYLFRPPLDPLTVSGNSQSEKPRVWENHKIQAELDRESFVGEQIAANQLLDDDVRYLAARILNGIPVLLVDGDPSADSQRSETHYLRHLGIFGTGLKPMTISVMDLENVSLADYRVLFLCNLDEVSSDRVRAIEQWVRDGGAVVFMPGNQVRAATFNETFYRGGEGISPIELEAIAGDPTMESWVNFEVDPQIHPALRTVVESDAGSLGRVDVFSWWTSRIPEKFAAEVEIPLRLSDEFHSPALVERSWGRGKVIAFAIPGDGDWSVFPGMDAVFVPVMLDLIDYLVGRAGSESSIPLGGMIEYPVDLSAYQNRVTLRDPRNEKQEVVARPRDETEEAAKSGSYQVQFSALGRRGFYELGLMRVSGEPEGELYAVNVPAEESKLDRIDMSTLESDFWGDKFRPVPVDAIESQKIRGRSAEMWPQVIWILLLILGTEQFLAWWFGKRR